MKKRSVKKKYLIIGLFLAFFSINTMYIAINNNIYIAPTCKNVIRTSSIPSIPWSYMWGGSGHDYGYDVAIDSSGNAYVAGFTNSYGASDDDFCLIKFNSAGVEWNHTWGGFGIDRGHGVAIDSSGNAYVSGNTLSFGHADSDFCLVKFNSTGGVEWNHTWGGIGDDYGTSVAIDSSGNAYVSGYTNTYGASMVDISIVKFNSTGGVEWNHTWGGSGDDLGHDVAIDSVGNAYVSGYTYISAEKGYDICLVKFNSIGVVWNHTWGGSGIDWGYDVARDLSGNFYVAGVTNSFGASGNDMCLVKFNSNGGVEWNHTWGVSGNDNGYGVALDSTGNAYVSGYTYVSAEKVYDMCLVKFNSAGVEWSHTWGGYGNDFGYGVAIDSSGNPYVTGYTTSYGAVNDDMYLVKFDLSEDSPLNIDSFPLIIIIGIIIGVIAIVAINMRGFYIKRGKVT